MRLACLDRSLSGMCAVCDWAVRWKVSPSVSGLEAPEREEQAPHRR